MNSHLNSIHVNTYSHARVIEFLYISTHDNLIADHFSRNRISDGIRAAFDTGFWTSGVTTVQQLANAGETRTLPDRRGRGTVSVDEGAQSPSARVVADVPRRRARSAPPSVRRVGFLASTLFMLACIPSCEPAPLNAQLLSVPYTRSDPFVGLSADVLR